MRWKKCQNQYFAHNSTPVGANVCEIKTTPHIRSFSTCSFRQTAILGGSDGRIEPNYFLYKEVDFLAEKDFVFFWFFEFPRLSPDPPAAPGPKKPGKYQTYRFFMKIPKIAIFPEIVISGSAAPGPKANPRLSIVSRWILSLAPSRSNGGWA